MENNKGWNVMIPVAPELLYLAAGIGSVMTIIITAIALLSPGENHPLRIADYYRSASAPPASQSQGVPQTANDVMEMGRQAFYIDEHYERAGEIFGNVDPENPDYKEARYYFAHTQLKLGHFEVAATEFDKLLAGPPLPDYIEQTEMEWNRMLCYIGADRYDQARVELRRLLDEQHLKKPDLSQAAKLQTIIANK